MRRKERPGGYLIPMPRRTAALPASDSSLGWSRDRISRFRKALRNFFGESSRPLSWRQDRDPYRILVSEVMLQQTRVATVTPYFDRWMARFPDLHTLASADEEEVLRLWAGLGYYSRARRLQQTVREVIARYDGVLPADAGELEKLPGIGPYTAGAIASIAFGAPVPAVDGNVRRVLARISDVGDPSPHTLQSWAQELVDPDEPGGFNQALMELGSLICTPRKPGCVSCPVAKFCAAKREGTQTLRPTPPVRRPPPLVHEVVTILLRTNGEEARVLLRRRPPRGLLGGMWEFPGASVEAGDHRAIPEAGIRKAARHLAEQLLEQSSHRPSRLPPGKPILPFDHIFSHRKVRYIPVVFRWSGHHRREVRDPSGEEQGELRWVTREESDELPLPAAQRSLASRVWSV